MLSSLWVRCLCTEKRLYSLALSIILSIKGQKTHGRTSAILRNKSQANTNSGAASVSAQEKYPTVHVLCPPGFFLFRLLWVTQQPSSGVLRSLNCSSDLLWLTLFPSRGCESVKCRFNPVILLLSSTTLRAHTFSLSVFVYVRHLYSSSWSDLWILLWLCLLPLFASSPFLPV